MEDLSKELSIKNDDEELFSEEWKSFWDKTIDEKSKKTNLTAVNVRSIIYQVITNKDVQVMFRNQLKSGKLKERLHEAIFEPKMTRSKLQEVLKLGKVPSSWKILPSTMKNKSLLDIDFGNEEDDEDYSPTLKELEHVSDDESASSSRTSECGSPKFPRSTLSSPNFKSVSMVLSLTPKSKSDDNDIRTLMGPPKSTLPIKKLILHNEETQKLEDGIALRTRSKAPLKDTSLTELENKIVDPDLELIEASSPIAEDKDWMTFLAGLSTDNPLHPDDEDTNDPEFNFLVEENKEKEDKEETRFDKGVQISKKEMNLLIDEFMEGFNDEEISLSPYLDFEGEEAPCDELQENTRVVETDNTECPFHIPKMNSDSDMLTMLGFWGISDIRPVVDQTKGIEIDVVILSEEEKVQLRVQMAQHVQLLAQTYICSAYSKALDLQYYNNASKCLLHEINNFKTKFSTITPYSFFNTPNLNPAIEITTLMNLDDDDELDSETSSNMLNLNFKQMDAIANSCAFLYPTLIPKSRMITGDDQISKMFLKSEDGLLAIGLQQFAHSDNKLKFKFIKEFLLPTKTENQIMMRLGNMRRRRGSIKYDNPLTYFLTHNKLPKFERNMGLIKSKDVIPPIQRDFSLLPNWFHNYYKLKSIKRPVFPYQFVMTTKLAPRKTVSKLIADKSETLPSKQDNTQSIIIVQVPSINSSLYVPQPIVISNVPVQGTNAVQLIPQVISEVSNPSPSKIQMPIPSIPIMQTCSSSMKPSNLVYSCIVPSALSSNPSISTYESLNNSVVPVNHHLTNAATALTSIISSSSGMHKFSNIDNRTSMRPKEPRRVVTFVESPIGALVGEHSEVLPIQPETEKKELQVTTSSGLTMAVKSLENSEEPCVVISHEQLKALGIKIDFKEGFQKIRSAQTVGAHVSFNNPLIETAMTETLDVPSLHLSVHNENIPKTIQPNNSISEVVNSHSTLINKVLDLSGTSEFLKSFNISTASKKGTLAEEGNVCLKQFKSLNGNFCDVSLNSTDTLGFHNLEDLMSSRELSRFANRSLESDNSLFKFGESHQTDLFDNSLYDNFINSESYLVASVGMDVHNVDSNIKNSFNEISHKNKKTSQASMFECFSSENVYSSTTITEDSSSKKRSQIVTFCKEDNNLNNSDTMLKTFNDACMEINGTSHESSCDALEVNEIILQSIEIVRNNIVDESLKVTFTAEESENYNPQLQNINHNEPDLMDQNATTLCTPKKFFVNEYDNVKKLLSPMLCNDVVISSSHKEEMSPNIKKQSLETIAQLEKLISPPKSPLTFRISSRIESPIKISGTAQQNQYITSPFKKRFSNFQPKQLDFCLLDGANDQKEAKNSKHSKSKFRMVAPKPPFIKITSELPKTNKKPLGRRKNIAPVKKPMVEILPKLLNHQDMTAPSEDSFPRFNSIIPSQGMYAGQEGSEDENVRIAELMSASTTIDKNATAQLLERQKALRQKERRDLMMSLLDEKLLESDPMRNRREILYAESYISRVKERFKHQPEHFTKFNQSLFLFTTDTSKSPNEQHSLEVHKKFYVTLRELFKDNNDLLSDYAGFLPLNQAVSLGCFTESLEFEKARIFMTKLQKYFKKRPQTFHRCLKALMDCKNGLLLEKEMRNFITKQIRNNPHLITEFSWFFPDDRPQMSHNKTAYEEIDLCSESERFARFHFEKVELTGENCENFGTTNCRCACHTSGPELSTRKSRHCASCNVKVSKGKFHSDDKIHKYANSSDAYQRNSINSSKESINANKDKSPSPLRPSSNASSKSKPTAFHPRFPGSDQKGKSSIISLAYPHSLYKSENISMTKIDHHECEKIKKPSLNVHDVCSQKTKNGEENKRVQKNITKCDKNKNDKIQSDESQQTKIAAKPEELKVQESIDSCDLDQILNQRSKRKRYVISSSESESEVNFKILGKKIRTIDDTDQTLVGNYSIKTLPERKVIDDYDDSQRNYKKTILQGLCVQTSMNHIPSSISCCAEWSREEDEVLLENCKTSGCDTSTFKRVSLVTHRTMEDVEKRLEYLMELYSKMD